MAKMQRLVIIRGDVVKRVPGTIDAGDGTIWLMGKYPLIDAESEATKTIGKDALTALMTAQRYAEIPDGCFARYGTNPSGLIIRDGDEYDAELRAAVPPALRARREIQSEIERLVASIREHGDSTGAKYIKLDEAKGRLRVWQEKYPEAALAERVAKLRAQAEHQRGLAKGALIYDADGSLSREDQQRRHDDFMAKATELENEAQELEQKG